MTAFTANFKEGNSDLDVSTLSLSNLGSWDSFRGGMVNRDTAILCRADECTVIGNPPQLEISESSTVANNGKSCYSPGTNIGYPVLYQFGGTVGTYI